MHRTRISSGSTFEAQIGYSRAVVAGDWVFVSGTTGFDYETMSIAEDLVLQTEQCMRNIESALRQANSSQDTSGARPHSGLETPRRSKQFRRRHSTGARLR